jgi:DNA-nicking Smr family endonuclease
VKRRVTSEDEKTLFRKSVAEASPQAVIKEKPKKSAARTTSPGLDGATSAKLKRGAKAPDAKLDLHGMTQAAAHRALLSFLRNGHKSGMRLVLVVTGQGNPDRHAVGWAKSPHGVLKEMVPRWLNEGDFAALITGTAPAHIRHGGDGALYVYLRK